MKIIESLAKTGAIVSALSLLPMSYAGEMSAAADTKKQSGSFEEAVKKIEILTQGGKRPEPYVSQDIDWLPYTNAIQNAKSRYFLSKITDLRSEKAMAQKETDADQVSAKYRYNKY